MSLSIASRRALLAPPPFSPLTISGLAVWLDAQKITGLAAGAAVAQWNDLSGNARHATQGTGAAQPTYQTGAIGGRPGVLFDSTDDWMTFGDVTFLDGLSAVSVFAALKNVGTGGAKMILSKFNGTAGQQNIRCFMQSAGYGFEITNSGGTTVESYGGTATTRPQVYGGIYDAAATFVYANGVRGDTDAQTGVFANVTTVMRLGADGSAGGVAQQFYNGYLGEVLLYTKALTAIERRQVEKYLGARWGLAL